MKWQFEDRNTGGKFIIHAEEPSLKGLGLLGRNKEMINTFVLNRGPEQQVTIDNITYRMPPDSILPLVANQTFDFTASETLLAWQFNREFYCIADHDAEVGCVGFLFYGIHHPYFIRLSPQDRDSITHIQRQCIQDMLIEDAMQGEMLRTLLKQLIINITRIARVQCENYHKQGPERMDIIRKFNLLLEIHFRNNHDVQFYAREMHRSPKTLTNLFGLCNYPSPSELIRQRILLEAKRYLYFTDKSAKEVAENLGFSSTAHFSRFFKAGAGRNFSEFRVPG